MVMDTLVQVLFLLLSLGMFLAIHNVPRKALTKLRLRGRENVQAKRHFVQGSHLLARARSSRNKNTCVSLAKDAIDHADKALLLDPRDAAAHILKALALDLQGHKSSALRSLDVALSPPAVKTISDRDRGDALFKRAELQTAVNRRRRVDSALSDLLESVKLNPDNPKAFCLLGQCYEKKEMRFEANQAYEEAIRIQPSSSVAREGLDRSASNCKGADT